MYVGSPVTFTSKEQGLKAGSIKALSEQIPRAEAEPCPQSHRDVLWEHEAISSAHPRQETLLPPCQHLALAASPPVLYSISCAQKSIAPKIRFASHLNFLTLNQWYFYCWEYRAAPMLLCPLFSLLPYIQIEGRDRDIGGWRGSKVLCPLPAAHSFCCIGPVMGNALGVMP